VKLLKVIFRNSNKATISDVIREAGYTWSSGYRAIRYLHSLKLIELNRTGKVVKVKITGKGIRVIRILTELEAELQWGLGE